MESEDCNVCHIIEIWKTAIDVQKHFNEICLRIRALAIFTLGALLSVAGTLLGQENGTAEPLEDLMTVLSILASLIWVSFFIIDRLWYYKLLKGAVSYAEKIECKYEKILPPPGLSQSISKASASMGVRSSIKLNFFYLLGLIVVASPLLALLFRVS